MTNDKRETRNEKREWRKRQDTEQIATTREKAPRKGWKHRETVVRTGRKAPQHGGKAPQHEEKRRDTENSSAREREQEPRNGGKAPRHREEAPREGGKHRDSEGKRRETGESTGTRKKSAATRGKSCARRRERHEIKRENKHSNGDLRITPCTRPVCGFTPREAVAMIMSCEGLVADPADSTDCPTFARRRDCSAAAAQHAHLPCSCGGTSVPEACILQLFICHKEYYCIFVLQQQ